MKPEILTRNALNRALLARQMLLAREDVTPLRAIERLMGLQAQQPRPPFVGLWTRIAGFAREDLLRPLRDREIVRATLMRGTLHLVAAEDYLSFRGAIGPVLEAGMKAVLRERAEGLDIPALGAVGREAFGETPRTFTALRAALMERFPGADERAMGYAVRMNLPLVAVPDDSPWGFRADPDFVEGDTWLGREPAPEARPHALALRYLAAFGPAAAVDVQAWSGLGGIRAVLDELRPQLVTFRDDRKRELFDLPDAPRPPEATPAPARFVADFDNLILAHADRSRVIADEHRPRVTTKNLLVLPTFLVDGFVAGTWKATRTKAAAQLAVTPFAPLPKGAKAELAEEGESLLRFLEPDAAKAAVVFETP